MHKAILRLNVNEQVEFEVIFCSDKPLSVKAKMTLQVEDNQYINTLIRLTGETYQEIVSLDNIRRSSQEMDQEDDERGKRRKSRRVEAERKKSYGRNGEGEGFKSRYINHADGSLPDYTQNCCNRSGLVT